MKLRRIEEADRCLDSRQSNTEIAAQARRLTAELRVAFPDHAVLSEQSVWPHLTPLNESYPHSEEFAAAKFFGGRRWSEISGYLLDSGQLSVWSNSPWAISEVAFFYFLPGFLDVMICDVTRGPTLASSVVARLQFMLDRDETSLVANLPKLKQSIVLDSLQFCSSIWTTEGYDVTDINDLYQRLLVLDHGQH